VKRGVDSSNSPNKFKFKFNDDQRVVIGVVIVIIIIQIANPWTRLSQFYLHVVWVSKFVKSALCSSNSVLSRLANLCRPMRCSDFGHQLTLVNGYAYIGHQSICHHYFSVRPMCTA